MKEKYIALIAFLMTSSMCGAGVAERVAIKEMNGQVGDTTASESSNVTGNTLEITTGSDKKTVSLKIGSELFKNNMSLVITAPLDSESDNTDINDGNSLVNGSSIKFNYQWSNSDHSIEPRELVTIAEACEADPAQFSVDKKDDCNKKIDDLIKDYKGDVATLSAIVNRTQVQLLKPLLFWGVTGTISDKEYEYFQDDSLDKDKDSENPWGASAYFSYGKPDGDTSRGYMWTFEYEFQERFDVKKNEIRCPTTSAGSFFSCVEAASSVPEEITSRVSSFEYRRKMKMFGIETAISPKASYNDKTHKVEVGVPVYLFQDGKGGLTGGVRADWENTEHDWEFSVFIGNKFTLF